MISHSVLETKPTVYSKNVKDTIIDLCNNTFRISREFFDYIFVLVEKDYVARPDLVSERVYGTPEYTDIICKLNGISNPFELNEGEVLICPKLDYVGDFYMTPMDSPNIDEENNTIAPKAKTVNDMRSPNEATVNDVRFSIDKTNRIITY